MTFDPSVLAILAFTVLLAALLTEASLTYRDWWRRWRTRGLVKKITEIHFFFVEKIYFV